MEQVKITYKGHEIELNRTEDGKFIKPDWLKKYEGSKSGFEPKPAVEHIIIGMKRTNKKSYIDNILDYEFRLNKETETTPFLQVPKPAKKEKDFGLSGEEKQIYTDENGKFGYGNVNGDNFGDRIENVKRKNIHPTTKPIKLMSYIITLFTREGDWVLDPFLGSGTTGIASKLINRHFVGIEREKEYFDICEERLSVSREELIKFFKMEKDTQTKLDL